ncbi:NAD-dependent epimerase/dehydratase family protein, partial [bacterium]
MAEKYILVAGGAGYIGSHMCLYLIDKGYTPIIFDNLSEGHKEAIFGTLVEGDLSDTQLLRDTFKKYDIKAVMHFAAHCYVGVSVTEPK